MQYKIIKLDRRYSHRSTYRYIIEFSRSSRTGDVGVLDFDRCVRWFNEQYGWSQNIETRMEMVKNKRHNSDVYESNDINDFWSYCTKYGDYRIYLATDKEVNWFVLNHPNG